MNLKNGTKHLGEDKRERNSDDVWLYKKDFLAR